LSISAIPDGRGLRITVKNIGDFTSSVHTLRRGTPVLIDGPFGLFPERPTNPTVRRRGVGMATLSYQSPFIFFRDAGNRFRRRA
jgi:predicted ferric reductase